MKMLKSTLLAAAFLCTPQFAPAHAADSCRMMEDVMAEGASRNFMPIKDISGSDAKAFMVAFNKEAPEQHDADQVRVFANPTASYVVVALFKQGCFVQYFQVPILMFKQISLDAERSLM